MLDKHERLGAVSRQIDRLDRQISDLQQISDRFTWARLLVFAIGGLLTVIAFFTVGPYLFWPLLVISSVLFIVVVQRHRSIERSQQRFEQMRAFKQSQLARANVEWNGLPPARLTQPRYDHPFEGDLDLVGEHSLHHLLDTTVSTGGCQRLRSWLGTTEPNAEVIASRQTLVAELVPRSLFRLRLWLGGVSNSSDKRWQSQDLLDWLHDHGPTVQMRPRLILLILLAGLNWVALISSWMEWTEPWWYYTFAIYFVIYMALSRPARTVFHEASALQVAVEQLAGVIGYLESYRYSDSPGLRQLCSSFLDQEKRPSRLLGRIKQVAAATGIQGNPIIWLLLNAAAPWDYYFAYQLNRYKSQVAAVAPGWLDTWAELEALSALANLAYLNPDYRVPVVASGDGSVQPIFSAKALGHPLLPDSAKVCNNFEVDRLGDVAILTGSNMAGKSTFLKTIGVNLALAYAGGPVNATALETNLFRLFTCIKVSDSVTDGISYFYAEVKRLKALLAALQADNELPLFFSIDEIFRGTNNRERLAGSRAYIRALVGKNGTGLISTHDLDLVALADEIETVDNYHFRDAIKEGRMVFDYRLRPGPCPTTNAIKIMALEGLPIDEQVNG